MATCPWRRRSTTERVYEGFLGAHEDFRTFFHGHTYTGNPLACAAALANLDAFETEGTLLKLQPKIRLLAELLSGVAQMPEVAEVRARGFMAGIDLGEHDPALRLGHRVTLAARERGAIVRPLGDTVVLMPPLAISKAELRRLVRDRRRVDHRGVRERVRRPGAGAAAAGRGGAGGDPARGVGVLAPLEDASGRSFAAA